MAANTPSFMPRDAAMGRTAEHSLAKNARHAALLSLAYGASACANALGADRLRRSEGEMAVLLAERERQWAAENGSSSSSSSSNGGSDALPPSPSSLAAVAAAAAAAALQPLPPPQRLNELLPTRPPRSRDEECQQAFDCALALLAEMQRVLGADRASGSSAAVLLHMYGRSLATSTFSFSNDSLTPPLLVSTRSSTCCNAPGTTLRWRRASTAASGARRWSCLA
jgi:hypothetical protein